MPVPGLGIDQGTTPNSAPGVPGPVIPPSNSVFNPVGGIISGSTAPQTGPVSQIPNFGGNASDELGWLYGQQWNQYLQTYAPQENLQLGLISDAGNALERQQAVSAAAAPYANGQQQAQLKRQALGYGQTLSPTQMKSFNQKANLQSGLDQVNAYNRTGTQQIDRAFGTIGAGAYQPGASVSNPATLVPGTG